MTGACWVKSKCSRQTGLINYWRDRCMSGGSKILNTDTGLINYQHDRCMLCGKKNVNRDRFFELLT